MWRCSLKPAMTYTYTCQIFNQKGENSFYISFSLYIHWIFEPRHDKTNNVAVSPAKTQISLGIRPVWSESSLSVCGQRRLWSDWADAQAECGQRIRLGGCPGWMRTAKTLIRLGGCPSWSQSSLGAAQSLCWFCHVAAHMWFYSHAINQILSF